MPLAGADAQLLAAVIAIRAARGRTGKITGQNLGSLRLTDAEGAVAALTALGWQFAGDPLGGDGETPVAVTVPNLAEALPLSGTARSRVSGWMNRTLAMKPVKKFSPQAQLAALFLAAHSSNDRHGVLPDEMPEHCRQALPDLMSEGFVVDLADDRYLLDESVRHLSGLHPRSHDSMAVVRVRWEVWKDGVSPALRRHAEAVEHCPLCALPLERVAQAFMQPGLPIQALPKVRTAYGAWKDTQPDRGHHAAEFAATWRAEHGHGPSITQLCSGLGWPVESRELRAFIVKRLVDNERLTHTFPVPWTLRPGKAAQESKTTAPVFRYGKQ
ncbi:hypothetical protein QT196_39015 (plasmid) [Streptomyces sp. P9-2B-2]|uniref:hypothetical protein n=1 Tax=Streptomyces sp. P9-2B-2 TaxID=3057114 RepID=UPI0025B47FA4|nr:hypothetical protein [Streptomyces sp. P9-2B-2]WJY43252.1 hypothetical protein QT196_39015 [Streptomyces sp. P9-2B-2]